MILSSHIQSIYTPRFVVSQVFPTWWIWNSASGHHDGSHSGCAFLDFGQRWFRLWHSLVHSEGYMFFDRQHGADSSGATPVQKKHTSALLHTACFTGIFDILPPSEFTWNWGIPWSTPKNCRLNGAFDDKPIETMEFEEDPSNFLRCAVGTSANWAGAEMRCPAEVRHGRQISQLWG